MRLNRGWKRGKTRPPLWDDFEALKNFTVENGAGAFQTLTQDQGTKLEGLMTSLQMHDASIDENVENISEGIGGALETIDKIKTNTDALPYTMR